MKVRRAGLDDIVIIQQLAHKTWPEAYSHIIAPQQIAYMLEQLYSLPALEHQIQNQLHRFFLLLRDDGPMGFASFSVNTSTTTKTAKLHKLYVLPQQQQQGAGRFLLTHIYKEVTHSGAGILELNVNRYNKNALQFYTKQGFTIIKEEDIAIGKGFFMNDFVMQKTF